MTEQMFGPEELSTRRRLVEIMSQHGPDSAEFQEAMGAWRFEQERVANTENTGIANIRLLLEEAKIYQESGYGDMALDILYSTREAASYEEYADLILSEIENQIEDIEGYDQERELDSFDDADLYGDFESADPARGFENEHKKYRFFEFDREQEELFKYCKSVAEYLHDKGIADLVIIDRSSRPMYIGVKECWRHMYPHEPIPGVYFLNPTGFVAISDTPAEKLEDIKLTLEEKGNFTSSELNKSRSREMVDEEFSKVYKRLVADREKPILIFDSCIHSGDTLTPVIESLKRVGFKDVHVGSINPADLGSKVQNDYFITREHPERGCYPFDRDRMIEKTLNHVYSERTSDPAKMKRSVELRREIKDIIKEKLGA